MLSYSAEGRIPFGRLVALGTDKDLQAKLPALAADVTSIKSKRGFTLQQHTIENIQDGLEPGYEDKAQMSVLSDGGIFVETEEVMTPASDIYVRFAGKKQVQTIVFDADLIAANVINGDVGAFSIAEITYDTSHANTMALIAAAILAANLSVESAVVDTRTITVTTALDQADQDAANFVVTLGASQAAVVETETITAVNSDQRGKIRSDADSASAALLTGARLLKGSIVEDSINIAVLEIGVV